MSFFNFLARCEFYSFHVAVKHNGKEYYVYDVAKIPDCAYTNKHYYNLTFCLQDDYYPT